MNASSKTNRGGAERQTRGRKSEAAHTVKLLHMMQVVRIAVAEALRNLRAIQTIVGPHPGTLQMILHGWSETQNCEK